MKFIYVHKRPLVQALHKHINAVQYSFTKVSTLKTKKHSLTIPERATGIKCNLQWRVSKTTMTILYSSFLFTFYPDTMLNYATECRQIRVFLEKKPAHYPSTSASIIIHQNILKDTICTLYNIIMHAKFQASLNSGTSNTTLKSYLAQKALSNMQTFSARITANTPLAYNIHMDGYI